MAINKQDQLDFAQQLFSLLNAGLALLNAIELIYTCAPKQHQSWLSPLHSELKKGNSFSQGLLAQKKHFSAEFINLIRVSERT